MSWSWSHTAEAYESVHLQLIELAELAKHQDEDAKKLLSIIWCEWKAQIPQEFSEPDFNEKKYNRAMRIVEKLPQRGDLWDSLVEDIWSATENLATCDNGGFNAWVCPWGCHTLEFSPKLWLFNWPGGHDIYFGENVREAGDKFYKIHGFVAHNAWRKVEVDEYEEYEHHPITKKLANTRLSPEDIPEEFPVRPLLPGQEAKDKVTCGSCGLSWDDAIPTTWTPAPSARCPFEYYHKYEND